MAFLNFGKKKEEQKASDCCSNGICGGREGISIKVLGAGCRTCHALYKETVHAVENMGLDMEIEYITDMEMVMGYGVMSMPALVINEQVISAGKVLKAAEVEELLRKAGL